VIPGEQRQRGKSGGGDGFHHRRAGGAAAWQALNSHCRRHAQYHPARNYFPEKAQTHFAIISLTTKWIFTRCLNEF
jgi:hypothetical protein